MTEATANNRSNGSLKSFGERFERLTNDKENIGEDIKALMTEAKSAGWNPKLIRMACKLRRVSKADRENNAAELQSYLDAMGE
jgi:uncharacterized protein (UPF0335 family)